MLVNYYARVMVAIPIGLESIVILHSSVYQIPALMVSNGGGSNSSGNFFSNLQAGNMSGVVTIRRKKRNSTLIHHPKRMFEEAQMARRVRAYLANLVVIGGLLL